MQAGDFRHRILIQKRVNEKWVDCMKVHARVNCISGSEYWAASAVQAQNTVNFDMRYYAQVADLPPQDCRIQFRGNIYEVQSIDNFEYRNQTIRMKGVMLHGKH